MKQYIVCAQDSELAKTVVCYGIEGGIKGFGSEGKFFYASDYLRCDQIVELVPHGLGFLFPPSGSTLPDLQEGGPALPYFPKGIFAERTDEFSFVIENVTDEIMEATLFGDCIKPNFDNPAGVQLSTSDSSMSYMDTVIYLSRNRNFLRRVSERTGVISNVLLGHEKPYVVPVAKDLVDFFPADCLLDQIKFNVPEHSCIVLTLHLVKA
jgi:hypothetical protein